MVGEGLYTHILYTYIRHRVRIGGGEESGGSMKEEGSGGRMMEEDGRGGSMKEDEGMGKHEGG